MTIRDEAFAGQPVSAFVIDAHTHLSPYYMIGWYQRPQETGNEAIIASLDRLGINCIVTAPHFIVSGMMIEANRTAARAAAEYPGRIYGYISICPSAGMDAIKAEIKKYGDQPAFVGFKFLPGYHGQLDQPEYQYAADYASEKRAVVLTHTWGNSPGLDQVEELAAKRPNMQLICAHQGGGSAKLSYRLAEIMHHVPNITMEICGSLENTLAIEDLVNLVGEDRIVYGSDLINLDPRFDFGRVIFSPLADTAKQKILSVNYLRLLGCSQMGHIEH